MRYIMVFLCFLLPFCGANAQDYRLCYDSTSVPELYNTTTIFLEQRSGNGYKKMNRPYKLSTSAASLKGNRLSYDPQQLTTGTIPFVVKIDNQEIPLTLRLPVLKDIRFNLYADSIKPVLNYYVNVEGIYSSGRVFPLNTDAVTITSDYGRMQGNEWIAPKERPFEKVSFTATSRLRPELKKTIIVYLKKQKDPRDAINYEDELLTPRRR